MNTVIRVHRGRINWLDLVICIVLVTAPILQQHKGFYINGGWTVLLLGVPFCLLRCILSKWKIRKSVFFAFIWVFAFYLWCLVDHGFSFGDLFRLALLMTYYLALTNESFNFKYFLYISIAVILAACVCLVLQYFSYYGFHRKLQFLSVNTLLSEDSKWYDRINSTIITGSFYRPSAFFLEPSHMFIFSFPTILIMLFGREANKRTHILGFTMIAGLLASTSGLSIVFSLVCIIAFYVMYKNPYFKEGGLLNFFTLRSVVVLTLLVLLLVYSYRNFDIVYKSIVRIIAENDAGYNAIEGRTKVGQLLLKTLSGMQYLIGVTDAMGTLGSSLSGFQATMYKYGAVGIILSYIYYFYGFIKTTKSFRYQCIVVLVLSFFCAHTHNYFYMLFYSAVIFEGLKENLVKPTVLAEDLPQDHEYRSNVIQQEGDFLFKYFFNYSYSDLRQCLSIVWKRLFSYSQCDQSPDVATAELRQ